VVGRDDHSAPSASAIVSRQEEKPTLQDRQQHGWSLMARMRCVSYGPRQGRSAVSPVEVEDTQRGIADLLAPTAAPATIPAMAPALRALLASALGASGLGWAGLERGEGTGHGGSGASFGKLETVTWLRYCGGSGICTNRTHAMHSQAAVDGSCFSMPGGSTCTRGAPHQQARVVSQTTGLPYRLPPRHIAQGCLVGQG
jgi:hypothetical protein